MNHPKTIEEISPPWLTEVLRGADDLTRESPVVVLDWQLVMWGPGAYRLSPRARLAECQADLDRAAVLPGDVERGSFTVDVGPPRLQEEDEELVGVAADRMLDAVTVEPEVLDTLDGAAQGLVLSASGACLDRVVPVGGEGLASAAQVVGGLAEDPGEAAGS